MQLLTLTTTALLALLTTVQADTWSISELNTHYMGSNSGLPGGQWPPASKFNSTIDFTVKRAVRADATPKLYKCVASFDETDVPKSWIPCDSGGLVWRLRTQAQTSAADFVVEMLLPEVIRAPTADQSDARFAISFSTVHVTANDKSNPTSYMTCMSGAPLSGITCGYNVNNVQLGSGGPIYLNMDTGYQEVSPFMVTNYNITTSSQQAQSSCQETTAFDLYRIDQFGHTQQCKGDWTCGALTNPSILGRKPPVLNSVSSCTGDYSTYDWFTSSAKSASDMTVNVRMGFCENTFFQSLDGTAVSAKMRYVGAVGVSVGDQLSGGCDGTTGPCAWTSPEGVFYPVPVTGYEVVADEGCGAARQ